MQTASREGGQEDDPEAGHRQAVCVRAQGRRRGHVQGPWTAAEVRHRLPVRIRRTARHLPLAHPHARLLPRREADDTHTEGCVLLLDTPLHQENSRDTLRPRVRRRDHARQKYLQELCVLLGLCSPQWHRYQQLMGQRSRPVALCRRLDWLHWLHDLQLQVPFDPPCSENPGLAGDQDPAWLPVRVGFIPELLLRTLHVVLLVHPRRLQVVCHLLQLLRYLPDDAMGERETPEVPRSVQGLSEEQKEALPLRLVKIIYFL